MIKIKRALISVSDKKNVVELARLLASKDIEILEKVQMKAVKQIQGLQATTYNSRLQELNLPTLTERRHRSDMIETFKIICGF